MKRIAYFFLLLFAITLAGCGIRSSQAFYNYESKIISTELDGSYNIRAFGRARNAVTAYEEARKQAVAEKMVRERMKRDKHIYFLPSEEWLGKDNLALSDGTHPTDLGFMRMAEKMEPALRRILRREGIK